MSSTRRTIPALGPRQTLPLARPQPLVPGCLVIKASAGMRRQAIRDELERLEPPADPQLTEAEEVLANFGSFWDREAAPPEPHRLLSTLFEHVLAGQRADRVCKPTIRLRPLLPGIDRRNH